MRQHRHVFLPLATAMLACFLSVQSADAGTISGATIDPASPGLGTASVVFLTTPLPGNDNATGATPNLSIVFKVFEVVAPIDIEFTVVDNMQGAGGSTTTEYEIAEFVDNDTGLDWTDYIFELGSGTGSSFVLATTVPLAGLDFDTPDMDPTPTSTASFTTLAHGSDVLTFSTGVHGSGAEGYTIRIDVPNGITGFTLRQRPVPIVVPEPTTLVLALFAGLMIAVWRRF